MFQQVVQFISLLLTALIAGTVFGIWQGYNPASFSEVAFVEQHQNAVRGLNVLIPVLGAVAILSTITWAYLQRSQKEILLLLSVAILLLVTSAVVTRFGNQPINAVIMQWSPQSPPANWQELRDNWWTFHLARTGTTIIALALLLFTTLRSMPAGR